MRWRLDLGEILDGIEVSIVTPMYNEDACVREFVTRVSEVMLRQNKLFEIIAVSDGSTDSTEDILRELGTEGHNLRAIMLSRNIGQWAAITAGLRNSRGRYVVVMDSDLQHLPEEIPLLIEEIRCGYDLVSGSRSKRNDGFFSRVIPSKIANWLLRITTKCPVRDIGGFKCLRGEIARNMSLRAGQHRLLPALVYLMGGSVSEVTVSAPPRHAGNSSYGLRRTMDVLLDIIMLWFESSAKSRPLYLFGRLAFWMAALTAATFIWLLYDDIVNMDPMTKRPAFYVAIALGVLSFHVLSVGLILEVSSTMQNRLTKQSTYRIREIVEPQSPSEGVEI